MGAIDRLLKRMGFVKLADYGLALSPEDRIVSLHDGAIVGKRAFDVGLRPVELALPAPPLRIPAPAPAPTPRPAQTLAAVQATEQEDDDGDWEWTIAIARARAAAEEIERAVPPSPSPSPKKSVTRPLATVATPSRTDRMPAVALTYDTEPEPDSWDTPAPPKRAPVGTPPPQPPARTARAATPVTIIPVPKLPRASTNSPVTPRLARGTNSPVSDSTRRYAAAPPANDDTNPDFRPSNRHLVARR